MESRTCIECGESLPITKFKDSGNGYRRPVCRKCIADRRRQSGKCLDCSKVPESLDRDGYCPECSQRRRECWQATWKRGWHRDRRAALIHYSGAPPRCMCPGCGEHRYEFLTLEHVGGWGKEHRKSSSVAASNLGRWLRRHAYPEGFTVLCWNCNSARARYGQCPHEREQGEKRREGASGDVPPGK